MMRVRGVLATRVVRSTPTSVSRHPSRGGRAHSHRAAGIRRVLYASRATREAPRRLACTIAAWGTTQRPARYAVQGVAGCARRGVPADMSRLAHSCIDNAHCALLQVDFDPRVVTYKQMLDLVWGMHDPYRNKSSRQYRNAIWYAAAARGVRTSRALTPPTHAHTRTVRYHNDEQKKVLLDQVAKMNNPSSGGIHRPVRSHPMPPQPLACRHASRLPVPPGCDRHRAAGRLLAGRGLPPAVYVHAHAAGLPGVWPRTDPVCLVRALCRQRQSPRPPALVCGSHCGDGECARRPSNATLLAHHQRAAGMQANDVAGLKPPMVVRVTDVLAPRRWRSSSSS